MFREGRLVQKNKRCCKNMHVFFHHFFTSFLWKVDARSPAKRANGYLYENRQKIAFGTPFWRTQNQSFVDFWIPSGSPGASKDVTEAAQNLYFFHESEEASENQPVALPGRLNGDARETPAVTQGSPGHQVTSLGFAEFFGARFDCAFFLWA